MAVTQAQPKPKALDLSVRFPGDRLALTAIFALAAIAMFVGVGAKQGWLFLIGAGLGVACSKPTSGSPAGSPL